MITVKFRAHNGSICMTMNGHAEAEDGEVNRICAGASTLAYTIGQEVLEMQERNELADHPTIILNPGEAKVSCKPFAGHYVETLKAYFTVQTGFRVLSGNFPKNVRLIPFESSLSAPQRKQLEKLGEVQK